MSAADNNADLLMWLITQMYLIIGSSSILKYEKNCKTVIAAHDINILLIKKIIDQSVVAYFHKKHMVYLDLQANAFFVYAT